ncbi:hypothetical protein F4809DRAFT_641396 [Biscogniauxia mediterranea]|nr:hypothetical protein F4809DRAFT_641396 [Biscogniauxia mediterranea]
MVRKLVTVRTITAIRPIQGADRIETSVLDGWSSVVPKGQFRPGDAAVFFEEAPGFLKFEVASEKVSPRLRGMASPSMPMPTFMCRTDQETTKMDGSSMTVYFVRRDSPLIDDFRSVDVDITACVLWLQTYRNSSQGLVV